MELPRYLCIFIFTYVINLKPNDTSKTIKRLAVEDNNFNTNDLTGITMIYEDTHRRNWKVNYQRSKDRVRRSSNSGRRSGDDDNGGGGLEDIFGYWNQKKNDEGKVVENDKGTTDYGKTSDSNAITTEKNLNEKGSENDTEKGKGNTSTTISEDTTNKTNATKADGDSDHGGGDDNNNNENEGDKNENEHGNGVTVGDNMYDKNNGTDITSDEDDDGFDDKHTEAVTNGGSKISEENKECYGNGNCDYKGNEPNKASKSYWQQFLEGFWEGYTGSKRRNRDPPWYNTGTNKKNWGYGYWLNKNGDDSRQSRIRRYWNWKRQRYG